MLFWSACTDVVRSRFVEYQQTCPDFATFAKGFDDDDNFRDATEKQSLPLFLPAEFPDQLPVRRCAANVLRIHFFVVDIDKGSTEGIAQVLLGLEQYGHIVYTTFSHKEDGQWKLRVMLKLSRPVDITEWAAFFPRAIHFLGLLDYADMKCADACHMYYVPGGDRSKYWHVQADGLGLDVDAILRFPLPAGMQDATQRDYQEVLPEQERAPIDTGLRDYWEALLQHLVQSICDRPIPGPIYDLKSHQVFRIARGCPHIVTEERLRAMIRGALDYRYAKASTEVDVEALRAASYTQVDLAIGDGMAKPWYPPLVNEMPVRPFTEFGLGERFVDQHKADVRYEPTWDAWITWTGAYWNQVAGDNLVQGRVVQTIRTITDEARPHYAEYWLAKELFESVRDDANISNEVKAAAEFDYEEKKELIEGIRAFALKSETAKKVAAATSLARSQPEVVADFSMFNHNPWLLNFRNGTLDLRTGTLQPHARRDYITRILPFEFDPKAKCPLFDTFLNNCMQDNQHMVNFLWRALGYSACGVTDEQKMFFCHGDGANGKSTFLGLMLELFGQGGSGYGFAANSSNMLTAKGQDKHETWRMDMHGKRFVASLEVDEGRSLAESLIKELTGGDTITGRKMRQDNWSYKPEFTLWLAINHLPHVRGTDEGIWRRLVVIEFLASFKSAPDKEMPRKLLAEAPGIWARIAQEARAWCRDGLLVPKEVLAATAAYREEQDPLKDLVEKWCVVEATGTVERAALWAAYEEHSTDTKTKTFHERKRFYAAVEKQFTIKIVNGYRYFSGIRLKTPIERIEALPRSILSRATNPQNKPN
jgi:putative DNA primase/helicase